MGSNKFKVFMDQSLNPARGVTHRTRDDCAAMPKIRGSGRGVAGTQPPTGNDDEEENLVS